MGRVGIAVSPARPERAWAVVEAEKGGVFRTDDGGETWKKVNDENKLRQRAWYYSHVYADPQNADAVYVLNVGFFRSGDGGKTFDAIRTPHGDNHDLWIDPADPARMIEGNDGGANVSFNGGRSWSSIQNQPTGQFYRVVTDGRFPYRVYGAQQDNSTVEILSRTRGGGIGPSDWHPVGGCESGWIAPKPDDPEVVLRGLLRRRHRPVRRPHGREPQRRRVAAARDRPGAEGPQVPVPVERADRDLAARRRTRSTTRRRSS